MLKAEAAPWNLSTSTSKYVLTLFCPRNMKLNLWFRVWFLLIQPSLIFPTPCFRFIHLRTWQLPSTTVIFLAWLLNTHQNNNSDKFIYLALIKTMFDCCLFDCSCTAHEQKKSTCSHNTVGKSNTVLTQLWSGSCGGSERQQRVEGEDGGCVEVVEVREAEGPEWIRVEGLFSVWLRPDGRRMASVAPGLWSV